MSKILVSGGLVPTTKDTLLDARTRVATFADIANIENPARFMVITVEDTGKKYEVRKLSSKIIGGIVVENSTIDIADPEALVDLGLAEELRSEDEKIRQSNESKRIEAENLRKSAEDSRKSNENSRISSENARVESERTRVSSEETRNANEQTRNSNESKRQSQESTRQSQESARQTNESTRNANESARKEAESERKTEETSRRAAELSRSSAENTRAKNEQNRTTAENTRSSAEDRRVANETQRTTNETARNNAELSREQAEGNRASTFNTLKVQMQTTIQEGQTAVAATEKATSDAQKVVDNYDAKVAEQDSKLAELGSKLNNSNPQIHLNSINAQVGGNLFNKNAIGIVKDRIFYDKNNDKYKENTGYNISEFISVVPNEIYSIDSRVAIKGYNKDMVFIASLTLDGTKLVIPNDIYWIRFSYYGEWGDTVYVNQGDVTSPSFQFGKIPTEKLKDGSVTKEKLATDLKDEIEGFTAKIKKVENKYILHSNIINVQGEGNIFNDAASGILVNKYFKDKYGNIDDREKYNVSDYMAVVPNKKYITSAVITIHCYDINYNHIGIVSASEKVFTTPENAFWIRFSYYATWYVWVLPEGNEVISKKYGIIRTDKIEDNAITHEKLSEDLQSKLGSIVASDDVKRGSFIHRGTLSSGEMFEFPNNSISVGEYITFSANIDGVFNTLYIGHGRNEGAYMKITDSEVIAYSHVTSPVSEKVFQHGLTIENNIQVLIEKPKNSTTNLKISSNGKSYSFSYSSWYGNKGTPFVESEGSELKDCSFGWTCKGINSDIWAFGDSYFGVTGTIRWMAYLIAGNHTNLVVNGFGGQGSVSAYTDLTNLLTIGTPKKILWCLGMNDADSSTAVNTNWLNTYNDLKSICNMNNIELVLATIPTVPSRIHKFKNEIIRSSGYRYIDFDKAVGADETTGNWFGDMLYSDGVHPSETGALALYHQAIADMPELLNC